MAAYRRVYDSRHLQADCQEPGSAPEPYARQSSMGYLDLNLRGSVHHRRESYVLPVLQMTSCMHMSYAAGSVNGSIASQPGE